MLFLDELRDLSVMGEKFRPTLPTFYHYCFTSVFNARSREQGIGLRRTMDALKTKTSMIKFSPHVWIAAYIEMAKRRKIKVAHMRAKLLIGPSAIRHVHERLGDYKKDGTDPNTHFMIHIPAFRESMKRIGTEDYFVEPLFEWEPQERLWFKKRMKCAAIVGKLEERGIEYADVYKLESGVELEELPWIDESSVQKAKRVSPVPSHLGVSWSTHHGSRKN